MKLVFPFALCLLICYIHVTSSVANESSTSNKSTDKSKKDKVETYIKNTGSNPTKTNDKIKESTKNNNGGTTTKDKGKTSAKDANSRTAPKDNIKANIKDGSDSPTKPKSKKTPSIRTPFDKVLDKLSNCASSSPSLVEVMQENLKEIQTDAKYVPLLNAAPHVATYLNKKKQDSTKFIDGLRQALNADWSNPTWKSWKDIDTLFRPLKQQFVYAMMRFNCT